MNWAVRFRSVFKRLLRQELTAMHVAFPAVVVEYLGPVPNAYGKGETPGVLKARAIVQPKYKLMRENKEEVEMPKLFNVPVSWYKMGDFLYRFPIKKGDVVLCVVSERALDHLIEDHEIKHPRYKPIFRLEDAIVLPFGIRMDNDPLTPTEYTDCLYIGVVQGNQVVSRMVFTPEGEIKFIAKKFTVISPDINLVDYGGPNIARIGDHTPGCVIQTGSPCAKCADSSSYAPAPMGAGQPQPQRMPPSLTDPNAALGLPGGGKCSSGGLTRNLIDALLDYAAEQGYQHPAQNPTGPGARRDLLGDIFKALKKAVGEVWEGEQDLEQLIDKAKPEDQSTVEWLFNLVKDLFTPPEGGGG